MWLDYTLGSIQSLFFPIGRGVYGWGPVTSEVYNTAVTSLKNTVKLLNTHLQGKEFLVGSRLSVADLVLAMHLHIFYQSVLDAGFRKAMPNVTGYVERIMHMDQVRKRIGNVKFCAKALKPILQEVKEEKKKEEAPKKQEQEPAPKKDVDPLDVLPPSSMDFDTFKKFFVNHVDRRGEGMQHFFDNFDKEGYTIYFLDYEKYEGEGVVDFQTSNLLNGFLQRIDHFRKHSLAMHCMLGKEPCLEIQGVWMFRGKGVPAQMQEHPQFEYYKTRELSIDNEEDRKLITDFWCAKVGDIVNGLEVQECKMHK
mmetsp:Transcript_18872/g.18031  ORF Transcript_18872/g.18031 Transcript_18872/m.18031 type:complete len:309 (+) Transcript_18872:306-1232(+)